MRIGSPSQTQSPQTSRWEVPDMDFSSGTGQQSNVPGKTTQGNFNYTPNGGSEEHKRGLEALKTQADKMNDDFYRIMSDKSFLETVGETYKDTFQLDSKAGLSKEYQKLIEKLLKSAQVENQQSPNVQGQLNQDAFEANAPDSAWRAFSGK